MLLDGIVASPELVWLATEEEKVGLFRVLVPSLPTERLPHITVRKGAGQRGVFPDNLPIGVESTGRVVFLYLVTTSFDTDFGAFVQRHSDLLRALPGWTLRLLVPREAARLVGSLEATARDQLTMQFSPETVAELKWYFEQRQTTPDTRARSKSDERFWHAQATFSTLRARGTSRRR